MTGYSQATARQPYLIKKKWSIVRQALHDVRPRVSHLTNDNYCVNAAPCRMLAWGKNLLNVKSCVTPTGPDHSKNRKTVYLDRCHQTGPEAGAEMTIKCPKCGTQLPVGSRLNSFGNLGRLGGWTLGSTNVEGGLHSPF